MPTSTDARKIRVKQSGAWIDPSVYVKIAGNWVRLDPVAAAPIFSPGLTAGTSAADLSSSQSLGADVVRVEFDIQTAPSAIQATIGAFAQRGARVLLLAGFDGYIPTTGQAQNLGTWAAAFGPGGTFWANRTDDQFAVQHIEFGNETSYTGQFGGAVGDAAYVQRAKDYAARFVSAADAITATGIPVGLLCQTDDAGTGNPSWVDSMYAQVPTLHTKVSGWTVHPYGPTYLDKTTRCCIEATGNNGAPDTVPIDITECGIASDNGVALTDNYGWPVDFTYAQAGMTLTNVVNTLQADAAIGPRLRHFMIYQDHDQRDPGVDNQREHYFGAVKNDLTDKGAYSTDVRVILGGAPPPPPPPLYPALKIPQNTDIFTSTGYRSAPATEFRDSMGVTMGLGGPNYPSAARRAFWLAELQYLGIRQVRYTPVTNDGNALQFCRDWSDTQVGTGTGRLLVEPGYLTNDWAVSRGCTGVKDSNPFRTIDFCMNLFLNDAKIRKAINVFEMLNEPNNFQCDKFTPLGDCNPNWHDKYGLTWLQCLGEYCKKVWGYTQNDPRAAGKQTVSPSPTQHYLIDSTIDAVVPDGADVKTQWGDVSQYCHYGSDHPYCGFLLPGKTFVYNTHHEMPGGSPVSVPGGEGYPGRVRGQGFWPQRRGMMTEFGYNTNAKPGVTPDGSTNQQTNGWAFLPSFEVLGNYWLRTFLECFIRGDERFYMFKLDNQGDALPRAARGAPDDFTPYLWNGTGTSASVTNWNIRTEAVDALHRFTSTIGDGTSQPNISWSVPGPPPSMRWLMLRRTTPSPAHILIMWRYSSFLKQTGVALDNHDASKGPPSVVAPTPYTQHVNLPNATTVVEVHPVDGAANVTKSFTGTGAGRGVDVTLAEKIAMLVIT